MRATTSTGSNNDGARETTCGVLSHPLRVRILEVANTQDVSPVQFVNEGLQPKGMDFKTRQNALSYVSYHFRELEKAGCIKVVETHQRRGATEHVYRGSAVVYFTSEEFDRLTLGERELLSRTSFQGLIARVDGAMGAKTFDSRTDRQLVWMPMELDGQGWQRLTDAMDVFFEEVEGIRHASKDRLRKSGEEAIPATFGMVGFESPPAPVRRPGELDA